MSDNEPAWKTVFLLITGLVALVADIITILVTFNMPHIVLNNITIPMPNLSFSLGGITNVHLAFAGIIYINYALTSATAKLSPYWGGLTKALLFPLLLTTWSVTYFSQTWWVVYICVFLSNFWLIVGLDALKINMFSVLILLFPSNAMIFLGFNVMSAFWAWMNAVLFFFLFLFFWAFIDSQKTSPKKKKTG